MGRCLTTGNFNKPKTDFIKANRKKRAEKAKAVGKAEKGKKLRVAVSGARTKKHARKVAHRERMLAKVAEAEAKEEGAAAEPKEVKMKAAVRTKKTKAERKAAKAAKEGDAMQE